MEVILLEKVQKLGSIGDVVNVKSGYARNFLVPQGKALYANEKNKLIFKDKKESIEKENISKKKTAETYSKQFKNKEVILIRAASESGQLYGSVTSKDIANSLIKDNLNIVKNQILLNKSIKYLTFEEIKIRLHPEITIGIFLNIARSFEEAEKQSKLKKAVTSVEKEDDLKEEIILDNNDDQKKTKVITEKQNKKLVDEEILKDKPEEKNKVQDEISFSESEEKNE